MDIPDKITYTRYRQSARQLDKFSGVVRKRIKNFKKFNDDEIVYALSRITYGLTQKQYDFIYKKLIPRLHFWKTEEIGGYFELSDNEKWYARWIYLRLGGNTKDQIKIEEQDIEQLGKEEEEEEEEEEEQR